MATEDERLQIRYGLERYDKKKAVDLAYLALDNMELGWKQSDGEHRVALENLRAHLRVMSIYWEAAKRVHGLPMEKALDKLVQDSKEMLEARKQWVEENERLAFQVRELQRKYDEVSLASVRKTEDNVSLLEQFERLRKLYNERCGRLETAEKLNRTLLEVNKKLLERITQKI